MSVDQGLDILKRSGLVCPFVTTPDQYGMEATPESPFFCWFKTANLAGTDRPIEPLFAECDCTAHFNSCPIYETNIPPL